MSSDLKLAEQLALKFHAGQKYGEDEPYFTHLHDVERAVRQMNSEDTRLPVIAWLHDILEDTDCSTAVLTALFEKDVVDAVIAMTYGYDNSDNGGLNYSDETKPEYLARCKANPLARQGKMADSYCNLTRSMQRFDMKRVQKYGSNLAYLAAP